jgi:hypothetical protein
MNEALDRHASLRNILLIFLIPFITIVPLMAFSVDAAPDAAPSISVSPRRGLAGSTVTLNGTGFSYVTGGSPAQVRWDGVTKSSFSMPESGSFSLSFSIPGDASLGNHTISICNQCGSEFEQNASVGFRVTQPPTSTPVPPKPTTPPPLKPTIPPPPKPTAPPPQPESVCGDLGLGLEAEVITFDPYDAWYFTTFETEFGVRFERSIKANLTPSVAPHSGDFAAKSKEGEFGSVMQPIRMFFTRPLRAVGMFVGMEEAIYVDTDVTAKLTLYGYHEGETEVVELGSDAISFPARATDIIHCLRFTAGENDFIVRALLDYIDEAGFSIFEPRWMDDLTMVFAEGELPEDLPPVVKITQPENDAHIIPEDTVNLRAEIIEDRELRRVKYQVNLGPEMISGFSRSTDDPTHYLFGVNLVARSNLIPNAVNILTVIAEDIAGQSDSDSVAFFYEPAPTPEPNLGQGTEPLDVTLFAGSLTQHGPFDHAWTGSEFQDFLIAKKDAMLRMPVRLSSGLFDPPVEVYDAELIMTRGDDAVMVYPALRLNTSSGSFDVGGPFEGLTDMYFYLPGEDLLPGEVTFDLHVMDFVYVDTVVHIDTAQFHEIPTQYQFYAIMDRALDSTNSDVFVRQIENMARIYPVPNGVATFSSASAGSSEGLIYAIAPGVIPLPRGFMADSTTYDFTWDFIHDGPGDLVRLKRWEGNRVDCNGDGAVDEDDLVVSWLIDDDGDGLFDPGDPFPGGHILIAHAEPEDQNGDGVVSQEEMALYVRSFKDLDGDGGWYDYNDPEVRDRFSAGDPYLSWNDENHNCTIDGYERVSISPSHRRLDNVLNYLELLASQLMIEFATDNDLNLMPSAVMLSKEIHTIGWWGSCRYGSSCWLVTGEPGTVIAHEIGHGWGLGHSEDPTVPVGAVNLREIRWVPEGDTRDFLFRWIARPPEDNFADKTEFEHLFRKGLDDWDYFRLYIRGISRLDSNVARSAQAQGGVLFSPPLLNTDQSFVIFGTISRNNEVSIWNSYILDKPAAVASADGDYSLAILNAEGVLLSIVPFEVSFETSCDGCSDPSGENEDLMGLVSAPFSVISPFPDGSALAEIRHSEQVLSVLTVSASAPQVQFIDPPTGFFARNAPIELRWRGSDPDGDSLVYTLSYSTDGGETYLPLVSGLRETTFLWNPAIAPGSPDAQLKVTAIDGFHRTSTVSNISLEPAAPSIHILRPASGAIFGHREMIMVEAAVIDLEDGNLPVQWMDEEGNIVRVGARIVLNGYEIGQHTFSAVAMDSDGNEVQASISFEVIESPPPQAEAAELLPGEVFVDQASLSIPDCTPHEATFSVLISDPSITISSMALLVSPSDAVPLIDVEMGTDESGVYTGTLQLNEDSPAGEWQFAVAALDEYGVSYQSETETIKVNACGEEARNRLTDIQISDLITYLRFILLGCLGVGLLIVIGTVVLRWSRQS